VPLELHDGVAVSQPAGVDVAANAGSLSPLDPKPGNPAAPSGKPAKPEQSVPQFDVVRVEPKGDMVVAGHGEPNAGIAVLADGKVIADGKADAAGQFVLIPNLAPGGHSLSLRSTLPRGGAAIESEQSVTVYIPREKGEEAAVALAEPGKPTILMKDPTAAETALPDKAVGARKTEAPAPQKVGKTAVAQPAAGAAKPEAFSAKVPETSRENTAKADVEPKPQEAKPAVSIKTAEVVEPGGFFATGRAPAGAHIRLYLNGSIFAEVVAGKDGHWSVTIGKGLIPGQYAVRADQIDGKGQVTARAEVTFLYKNEAKVAEAAPKEGPQPSIKPQETTVAGAEPEITASTKAPSASQPENAVVAEIQTTTVEKGNSLWRISRQTLGHGKRYTEIYAANSTQIRDPKLIYPGQVFVIPGQIN